MVIRFLFRLSLQVSFPEKESLWLRNLTNQLKSTKDGEELIEDYKKHKKNTLYESVMDIIVRANEEKI